MGAITNDRRTTGRRPGWLPASLLALLLPLAAGCTGEPAGGTPSATPPAASSSGPSTGPSGPTSGPSTAPGPAPTSTPAVGPAAPPAPTGTAAVVDPADPAAPAAVLVRVRAADRGAYDRVVLDFDRPFGGYSVQYVDEVTEDPTGDPVPVAGGAALLVVVQGATLDNAFQVTDGVPRATYGGPRRVPVGLPAVQEVVDAGDFEAVLSLAVGTARTTGFRVLRLTGPDRLVIDVAH